MIIKFKIPDYQSDLYLCYTCEHFLYLEKTRVKCALKNYMDKPLALCTRYKKGLNNDNKSE